MLRDKKKELTEQLSAEQLGYQNGIVINSTTRKLLYDNHNLVKWQPHIFSTKNQIEEARSINISMRIAREERLSYAFLACVYFNWGLNNHEISQYFEKNEKDAIKKVVSKHSNGFDFI